MSLADLRKRIDALDEKIIALLNDRADLVHEVGNVKKAEGLAIYVPEREEQLLRGLVRKSKGRRLPAKAIRAIYREIMSASYALEKGLRIGYLGPAGTYTHEAARAKFGASVEYETNGNIAEVFQSVLRGQCDYGVVPIENSTEGVVNHTLDEFMDSDLKICAQILLPIRHNLLSRIPAKEIRRIYSHPQSFAQCRQWLRTHLPGAELIEVSSNTRAAERAAEEINAAAIAGNMAAELYQLPALHTSIQDYADNTTRFLVISHTDCPPSGDDKTSMMFSVQDKPGALFKTLEPLKRLKINMSKIESRPSKRKAWEYFFFVDIDGHATDPLLVEALAALARHCTFIKILGSYPKAAAN